MTEAVVTREIAAAVTDPDLPGWRRPAPDAEGLRADLLIGIGLFVGALLAMVLYRVAGYYDEPAAGWLSVLVLAAITLPLIVRRRWPTPVAVVVTVAALGSGFLLVPEVLISNIALFTAFYTVGAWEQSRRRAFWARTAITALVFGALFVGLYQASTDPEVQAEFDHPGAFSPFVAYMLLQMLTNVLYVAGAWWFGDHTWNSARERARTAWRGKLLAAERLRAEEQAVALERLRLARELHDSLAHHVSLMGVQAAAARTLLTRDPAAAARALEQVEESAREAVDELGGVLGVLRGGGAMDEAPGEGIAAAGVDRLGDLVEQARAVGMAVAYTQVGEPVRVAPMTSLAAYRVAQEALTNARKHAGASARADVRLRWLPEVVEIEVSDDGTGTRRSSAGSTGLGLLGMRERVAALGGTLTAGPRERAGFLVRARLPIGPPSATPTSHSAPTTSTEPGSSGRARQAELPGSTRGAGLGEEAAR